MTVENLTFAESYEAGPDVQQIEFCDVHHSVVRALLIERGFGADCELTDEERRDLIFAGKMDAMTEMTQTLMVGVLSVFGGDAMARHLGCPVCVLEGTTVRAADEIAAARSRKN